MRLLNFQKNRVFEGFLVALGVALLPIYVFKSGGVQPSHMVLALFALVVLCRWGMPSEVWVFCLAGVSFYSFFLEGFYVTTGAKAASLMASIFFFYNLFLASAVYSFARRYGLSAFTPGVFVACVIAIVAVGVGGVSLQEAEQGRATGAFNNPNQLGYFSVCLLSLTYLLYSRGHLKYLLAVGMFSVAVFLSVASLSKAAMIANFVVVFLALKPISRKRVFKSKLLTIGIPVFWLFVVSVSIIIIVTSYLRGGLDDYLFVSRLQGMAQEADSSLESRGYFAFLEGTTIKFLLGLGTEGVTDIVGHEVHSTLASVLNNYGVIGFMLFFGVLVTWALKLWRAVGFIPMACLTGPAMLYGITHNGTRFTAFWILFATSMAMADRVIIERKLRQQPHASQCWNST